MRRIIKIKPFPLLVHRTAVHQTTVFYYSEGEPLIGAGLFPSFCGEHGGAVTLTGINEGNLEAFDGTDMVTVLPGPLPRDRKRRFLSISSLVISVKA